jgi:hypothetical protein
MVNYPVDSEGTTFDPAIHNLLDKPARPEVSTLGKFVKVRGNDGNDQDLIDRFHESLKAQESVAINKPVVTASVIVEPKDDMVKFIRQTFDNVIVEDIGDSYRVEQDEISAIVSKNVNQDAVTAGLRNCGFRFA